MPSINIRFDLSALAAFAGAVGDSVDHGLDNPNIGNGFDLADELYIDAQQQRFDAEGDGEWQPLADSTKAERKRLGYGPDHPILKRSGALYAALTRGNPGNFHEMTRDKVESGFGGNSELAMIAAVHQHGGGRVPARPILTQPTAALLAEMSKPITDAFSNMIFAAVESANGV